MPKPVVNMDDRLTYPGIGEGEKMARDIRKPNGDRVILYDSGSVVVHRAGKTPRTRTAVGHLWTLVDGREVESIPKIKQPPAERPLNVVSGSSEMIARELSNFAERRFELEGKGYHSVEGWYQGLKWPDEKKRREIAKLFGGEAKRAGKGAPPSASFHFLKKDYLFGSAEHHELIKNVIRVSVTQSPELARAFHLTYPRPIVHDTGRAEKPGSALPGVKFAQILEEIRAELVQDTPPD